MKNRIREIRKKKNLTLKELSQKLAENNFKITPDALAKYETGKREPRLETWQKLADYFDVPVPYLQGFMNTNIPNNSKFDFKKAADTITDGFRNFLFGTKKEKDGSDLVFYGEVDPKKALRQFNAMLPPLPDDKPQLKDLKDQTKALENKNAELEGELSAYRQILKAILEKSINDEKDY